MSIKILILSFLLSACTPFVRPNPEYRDGESAGGRGHKEDSQTLVPDNAGQAFLLMFCIGAFVYIIVNEVDKQSEKKNQECKN